jgi:hypothetical protein
MEEFLNKLYSINNFSLYLTIAIVVLVILFIIVLFFGKKDQKERELEATKKLQQLENTNTFKQENNEFKVEVNPPTNIENDTIMVPRVDDTTINNMAAPEVNVSTPEPVSMPVMDTTEFEAPVNNFNVPEVPVVEVPDFSFEQPTINNEELPQEEEKPVFEREEETPFAFSDEANNVEVPDFNLDDILNTAEEVKEEVDIPLPETKKEVFSSVYAPKKDEDDLEMELPTLKNSERVEVKEESKELEKPVLTDYNLDELSGEVYNINKD